MKQLSEVRSSTPLNLSSTLAGETESVGGDEEKLEAGKGGACQLQQHILQSLPRLSFHFSIFNILELRLPIFEGVDQNYDKEGVIYLTENRPCFNLIQFPRTHH